MADVDARLSILRALGQAVSEESCSLDASNKGWSDDFQVARQTLLRNFWQIVFGANHMFFRVNGLWVLQLAHLRILCVLLEIFVRIKLTPLLQLLRKASTFDTLNEYRAERTSHLFSVVCQFRVTADHVREQREVECLVRALRMAWEANKNLQWLLRTFFRRVRRPLFVIKRLHNSLI